MFNFFKKKKSSTSSFHDQESFGIYLNSNNGFFGDVGPVDSKSDSQSISDMRIEIKPIDVVNQLKTEPKNFDLVGLDYKIKIFEDKLSLIKNNSQAKQDTEKILYFLKNRKCFANKIPNDKTYKHLKGKTYREYFSKFDITTQEKIDDLLKKYKLVMKPSDIFIPEFPNQAIVTMKESEYVVQSISDTKVKIEFSVIAEDKYFNKVYEKRDPILLMPSPFGYYYYILGAWDKEMLLLTEL